MIRRGLKLEGMATGGRKERGRGRRRGTGCGPLKDVGWGEGAEAMLWGPRSIQWRHKPRRDTQVWAYSGCGQGKGMQASAAGYRDGDWTTQGRGLCHS